MVDSKSFGVSGCVGVGVGVGVGVCICVFIYVYVNICQILIFPPQKTKAPTSRLGPSKSIVIKFWFL